MYKDMFNEKLIPEVIIDAAKELSNKLWSNEDDDNKFIAITDFSVKICNLYKMDYPAIKVIPDLKTLGTAIPQANTILLKNYSFVTFLHEFRHLMQYNMEFWEFDARLSRTMTVKKYLKELENSMEEDARGFSVSLFYMIAPEKYEAAVQNNTLAYK